MSFSRRKEKIEKEKGGEVSVMEMFKHTHYKVDGTLIPDVSLATFKGQLPLQLEEEARRLGIVDRELTEAEKVAPINRTWLAVHGVDNHGRVLALGSETSNFRERNGHQRASVRMDPLKMTERFTQMTMHQQSQRVGEQMGSRSKNRKGKEKMPSTQATPQQRDWPPGYYRELEAYLRAYHQGEISITPLEFAKFLDAKWLDRTLDSDSD